MGDPGQPIPRSPVDVYEKSYDEVLSALKHQDDKLNRTLTALAFLTGAAVALMLNVKNVEGDEALKLGGGPEVTDFMFVVFVFATVMALALALAAIGPSSPLSLPKHTKRKQSDPNSLLFWGEIARDEHWKELLKRGEDGSLVHKLWENTGSTPQALEREFVLDLHREAQEIAKRVRYKVSRSRESSAFVFLAIVALGLIAIFATGALSTTARWWVATALLVLALSLPLLDVLHMRMDSFETRLAAPWAYVMLVLTILPVAGLLVLGKTDGHYWPALYTALGALLLTRLALVRAAFAVCLLPIAMVVSIGVLAVVLAQSVG